jgi:hypothetical protein
MAMPANFSGQARNRFEGTALYASFKLQQQGRQAVVLSLRLEVLAVCAVFAFVGAILLGAF